MPPFVVSDELAALKSQVRKLRHMRTCVHDFEQQEAIRRQFVDQFYDVVDKTFPAAIAKAFEQTDQALRRVISPLEDGSTAVVVWLVGHSRTLTLYCANVGDSRAVLSRDGVAVGLSADHKPENPHERTRIEHQGGAVYASAGGVQRLYSPSAPVAHPGKPSKGMAVSRAFGDYSLKEPLNCLACQPDVHTERLRGHDELLVVASDGVRHALSNEEAVDMARQLLATPTPRRTQSSRRRASVEA